MAYNVCPHFSAGVALFYLMFGCNTIMPILFKVLLPKLRHMGDAGCRIYLDAIREIYMMAVLNLKIDQDKRSPIKDPDKAKLKVGDMVLMNSHAPTSALTLNTNPVS